MTNLLKIARSYVEKGVSVMPVRADKKPSLPAWKDLQSRLPTDTELIEWFTESEGIGIITGKISNLSVVDIDVQHGGTPKGLPPTLVARTQSGGWHFYYRYMEGLPNKAGIAQGIDIRSDGGYVVAPPTIGVKGAYEWAIIEEPQPFPIEVLKIDIPHTSVDWKEIAAGVPEGGRNEMAAKFIGKLLKSFKPEEWESAVWLTVLNWNKANKPPLPEAELRATFNSIAGREVRKPKATEEEDSPVILLSEAAKKFSDDFTAKYTTGYGIINDVTKGGLTEGDLFLIVGETGHGKTTAAQSITASLFESQVSTVWFSFEVVLPELWEKFKDMGMEDNVPIYTPEKYLSRGIVWLRKKIIEARDTYKCKVVFIDHLGFLIGEYDGKSNSRLTDSLPTLYGLICRDLKTIAVQERIVVVLLWHTKRTEKAEPGADDVKDSSAILQECDLAINVAREKLNSKNFKGEVQDVLGANTFIKMLKNRRTGVLKRFMCKFENHRLVEDEISKEHYQQEKDANERFQKF